MHSHNTTAILDEEEVNFKPTVPADMNMNSSEDECMEQDMVYY
jgi:hypothetical protein